MNPSFQLETSGLTCEGESSWLMAVHVLGEKSEIWKALWCGMLILSEFLPCISEGYACLFEVEIVFLGI
jgi:hypothetical protein